jgi:hypothetical protein
LILSDVDDTNWKETVARRSLGDGCFVYLIIANVCRTLN